MVGKSPNCQAYTQHLSVYVDGKASFTPSSAGAASAMPLVEVPMDGLFVPVRAHRGAIT